MSVVDMDQFQTDLVDFVEAVFGQQEQPHRHDLSVQDVDEAEAILLDLAADLANSQACRDLIGQHSVFWTCISRLADACQPSTTNPALVRLILKSIRNACITCPASQRLALSLARADRIVLDFGSAGFAAHPRDLTLLAVAIEAATNLAAGSDSPDASSTALRFGASRDSADLAKWALNMLLAHPTKAMILVMVWLANGILPLFPVDSAAMERLSPGALVLERVFLMATPEKASVEDPELAMAAGLSGFASAVESDHDAGSPAAHELIPYATAIVSALIRHDKLILAYQSSANMVRADLLLHTHAVLSDESLVADAAFVAKILPVLDFFVDQLGALVSQITTSASPTPATSPSLPPPLTNPVVLIELLHVLELATLKLTYQPPALLTHTGHLLAWLHANQPRATAKQPASAVGTSTEDGAAAVFGTKKMVLLVIAQLVADNRALQDQARAEGLVPLVVAQCTFDDFHPFIREYGIYCLRNLLHANRENQALIEGMKVVDVADETKQLLKESNLKIDPERLRERLIEKERERAREEQARNGT